jgi:hypothetical protein
MLLHILRSAQSLDFLSGLVPEESGRYVGTVIQISRRLDIEIFLDSLAS